MTKKKKIIIGALILLLCIAAGGFLYYKMAAPPGEEWLAYHNEELISNIDSQSFSGLDIEILSRKRKTCN